MDKVIPILPCQDIKAQVEFYEMLGFEVRAIYTSPNPYGVVARGELELHFYGSRKFEPATNASMCYMKVDDVDEVCGSFTSGLKANLGKVPRNGLPRISKVRDLALDRRFTMTDPGGNTFYIGTPVAGDAENFFRTLEHAEHAKKFAVLYDVLYSKEDPKTAAGMLPKFDSIRGELSPLDLAKLILVELEIRRELGEMVNPSELEGLLVGAEGDGWETVRRKYSASSETD